MLAIVLAIVLASERQRGRQDDVLLSDASIVAGLCDLFGLARWYLGGVPVAGCFKKAKIRTPLKPQLRRISFSSFFEF
jgi:hypothetical protein